MAPALLILLFQHPEARTYHSVRGRFLHHRYNEETAMYLCFQKPASQYKYLVDSDCCRGSHAGRSPETPLCINVPTERDLAEGTADLPDQHLCVELADIYCNLLHDKQHALFHLPTFIAKQRMGRAPTFLVLGIMALVARFVGPLLSKMVFMVRCVQNYEKASESAKRPASLLYCTLRLLSQKHVQLLALGVQYQTCQEGVSRY
jgi:hypothetical protein